jgi:hypothetical protein
VPVVVPEQPFPLTNTTEEFPANFRMGQATEQEPGKR